MGDPKAWKLLTQGMDGHGHGFNKYFRSRSGMRIEFRFGCNRLSLKENGWKPGAASAGASMQASTQASRRL